MPPPHDGNEYTEFQDLIRLERINRITFRSIALPFSPGGQLKNAVARSYGGHVYAQAAWAACQTVKDGLLLYTLQSASAAFDDVGASELASFPDTFQNVIGHFHRPGSRTTPFVYTVKNISDGRSTATREVSVVVQGEALPCFTSTCSFKRLEDSLLDVQDKVDLWKQYEDTLRHKRPDDFEEVPGVDAPWYWQLRKETGRNDSFPGLDMRKVDQESYNKHRHPLERRGLIFYRPIGQLAADPNLHLCAHLYASDRNSLYIVANQMDVGDLYTQMSSLVHQTSFHGNMEDLMFGPSETNHGPMDDKTPPGKWFCKEDLTLRAASGRAMLHGRLWASNGAHIGTVTQDGMIRFTKKPTATAEEATSLRTRQARWPPREKL
ncbi:uncharacterized protein LTR77_007210 [Saxophila tyrrhenica]|uniref:Thioesterase/thiol ester dehydrase-isomerase n=1 Tax=Saxophila tyrrhenica TaxID=1690608 RepID=A0AAV9P606_9PEZI|nr:hypothetical protein LTR77_007210 [Saxophila tyrrhenica]